MISKLKITLAVAAVVLATTGCNSLADFNNSLAGANESLAQVNDKLSNISSTSSKTKDELLICYNEDHDYYYDNHSMRAALGRDDMFCNKGDKLVKRSDMPKGATFY